MRNKFYGFAVSVWIDEFPGGNGARLGFSLAKRASLPRDEQSLIVHTGREHRVFRRSNIIVVPPKENRAPRRLHCLGKTRDQAKR